MTDTETTKTSREYTRSIEVPFDHADDVEFTFEQDRKSGGRTRSDYAQSIDAKLTEAYDSPRGLAVFQVAPTEVAVDHIKRQVRNSANYLGLGLKVGKVVRHPETGNAIVPFKVVTRQKRTRKPKAA